MIKLTVTAENTVALSSSSRVITIAVGAPGAGITTLSGVFTPVAGGTINDTLGVDTKALNLTVTPTVTGTF
jgi:hypothetical protein